MAKLPAHQQYIGKGIDRLLFIEDLPDLCCNPSCDAPVFDLHHIVRRSYLNGPFNYVELFGRVWLNIAPVCRSCHDDLEQNRAHIAANLKGSSGFYSWDGRKLDPYPNPVLEDGESSAGMFPPFHAGVEAAGSPSSSTGAVGQLAVSGSAVLTGEPERASEPPGGIGNAVAQSVGDTHSEHSHAGVPVPSVTPGETCPQCNRRVPHPRKPSSPKSKVVSFRVPLDESDDIMESWKMRAERLGVLKLPHWQKHYLDITNSLIDGLSEDVVRAIGKDYLGDL